jgi:enoyl-CoA hydratase/carnithine racemase
VYDLPPELVVTAEGPVRLIELNRPDRRNAASEALHAGRAGSGCCGTYRNKG